MRSAMIVPMRIGARTTGAITFVSAESLRVFDAADLAFAQEIARRAAVAVENARLYTERSAAADTLQRSLLPESLPRLAGFQLAASYRPGARGTDVGGDFYDVFAVGGGFMVVLGDVTGKGVRAAALTSLARHTARNAAVFVEPRPGEVLRRVDGVLREHETPALVTIACAMFEVEDGGVRMTVASGGHPLPIRVTAAGGVAEVGEHGMLLGAFGDGTWPERSMLLADGDTVLFYTDGVIDTPGSDRRFGEERLLDTVALAPRDPDGLVASIDAAVVEFQHGRPGDDRAMLALQLVNAEVAQAVRRADRRRRSPG
jgi:serine phosphatase RsbU (regulator of sigma subunit)